MKHIKKIVLVTGGFDPLHSGHILLLKNASKLGTKLIVGVNSNRWLIKKKGFFLLPISERKIIIENLVMVNKVIQWNDNDGSAAGAIKKTLNSLNKNEILVFANGGDRTEQNIPEIQKFKNNEKVKFLFGVGGDFKKNSSSQIIKNFKNFKISK